jgi:hypothetical protein
MKNILVIFFLIVSVPFLKAQNCSIGGTVSGSATVCSGNNSGMLMLSGQTGNVIRWESSTDNFVTTTAIANTSAMFSYANIIKTTKFRAVVQSGICTAAFSSWAGISVDPLTVAGTLSGDATVCENKNNGFITLSGQVGTIVNWESSTDNFNTSTLISNTTNSYLYSNLSTTSMFRVVVQ